MQGKYFGNSVHRYNWNETNIVLKIKKKWYLLKKNNDINFKTNKEFFVLSNSLLATNLSLKLIKWISTIVYIIQYLYSRVKGFIVLYVTTLLIYIWLL